MSRKQCGCFSIDPSFKCDHDQDGLVLLLDDDPATMSKKLECPRADCPTTWPESVESCTLKPCPMRGENTDRKPMKPSKSWLKEPVLMIADPTPQELGAEVTRRNNASWEQQTRARKNQDFTWAYMRELKARMRKSGTWRQGPLQHLGDHLPTDLRYWPVIR